MGLFKFFTNVWNKLNWFINFIYTYISPIYKDLVEIIKDVQNTDLTNEAARKEVFKRISKVIKDKGLNISDSILNAMIELIYQLVKQGKE